MSWLSNPLAPIVLLQAALVAYVIVWPVFKRVFTALQFALIRATTQSVPDVEPGAKRPYRGAWRDAAAQAAGAPRQSADWGARADAHARTSKPPFAADPRRKQFLQDLGLQDPAHLIEIKTAYREMAKTYHPDRFASALHTPADRAAAAEKMQKLNRAYDWLRANG
ncbi:MAG: J domain-containing protein [Pseudomonadota bacterium]